MLTSCMAYAIVGNETFRQNFFIHSYVPQHRMSITHRCIDTVSIDSKSNNNFFIALQVLLIKFMMFFAI